MNKIGVRANTALPPTSLYHIFYVVNISFFRIYYKNWKLSREIMKYFPYWKEKYSFLFHIYLMFYITLSRVSKIWNLLPN